MGRGGCNCCGDFVTTALMSPESGVMQWNYSYGIDTRCLGVIDNEIVIFPSAGGWWWDAYYNGQMWKDNLNGSAKYDVIAGYASLAPSTKIIDTNGKLITQDVDFFNSFGANLYNDGYYWYYWGEDTMNSSTLDVNTTPSGAFITNRWIQMYATKDPVLQEQSSILYYDDAGRESIKGCKNIRWDLFPQYIKPFRANVSSNTYWDYYGYYGWYNGWYEDVNNNIMKYAAKNLTYVDQEVYSIALRDSFCKAFRINLISIDDENFNFEATLDVDIDGMMQSYIDKRLAISKTILQFKEQGIGGVGDDQNFEFTFDGWWRYHGGYTETPVDSSGNAGSPQQFPPSTITTKLAGTQYTFPQSPATIYGYAWSGLHIGYSDGDYLTPTWNFSNLNISGIGVTDQYGNPDDNYIGNLRVTSDPYQPSATFTISRKYFPVNTYLDGGSGIYVKAQTWDQAFAKVECDYTINYDVDGVLGGVYSGESFYKILGYAYHGYNYEGPYGNLDNTFEYALLDQYSQNGFYSSEDFGMNVSFNMSIFQGYYFWTGTYADSITEVTTVSGETISYQWLGADVTLERFPAPHIYALDPINFIHTANVEDSSFLSFLNLNDIVYNSSIYDDIVNEGDNATLPTISFRQSFDYMDEALGEDDTSHDPQYFNLPPQSSGNVAYDAQSDSGLAAFIQAQKDYISNLDADVVDYIPNQSLVVHSMSVSDGTYKVICTVPIDRVEYTYGLEYNIFYLNEFDFQHDYYYHPSGDGLWFYDKRGYMRSSFLGIGGAEGGDIDPHKIVTKIVDGSIIPGSGYKSMWGIQHYLLEIDADGTLLNYNQMTGDMTRYLDRAARIKLNSTYAGENVWGRYSPIYSLGVSNENVYMTIDDNGASIGYSYIDSILSALSTGRAIYYTQSNNNPNVTPVIGINRQTVYYIPFTEDTAPSGYLGNSTMDMDVEGLIQGQLEDLHHNVIIGDNNGDSFQTHHVPSIQCTAPDLQDGYLYVGSINSSNRVRAILANGLINVGQLPQIPIDPNNPSPSDATYEIYNEVFSQNDAWQVYPHIYLIPDFHPETIIIPDYNLYPDAVVPGVNLHIGSTIVFIGVEDTALEVQNNLHAAGLDTAQVRGGPLLELTLDIGGIDWSEIDIVDGFRMNDSPGLFNYSDGSYGQWVYNFEFFDSILYGFGYGYWYYNYYWGDYWEGYWGWGYLDTTHGDTAQPYCMDKRLLPISDAQAYVANVEYIQFMADNGGYAPFQDYAATKGFDARFPNDYTDPFDLINNHTPHIYLQREFICPTMLFADSSGNGTGNSAKIKYDDFISQERYSANIPYPQIFDLQYMDSIGYPRSNNLFTGWVVKVENSTSTIQSDPAALYKFNVDGTLHWYVHYGNLNYFDTDVPIGSGVEKSPTFCGVINDIKVSSGFPYITGNVINLDTAKPKVFHSFDEYYNNVVCRRVAPTQFYFNQQYEYSGTISDCLLNLDDNIRIVEKWFKTYEKIKVFN